MIKYSVKRVSDNKLLSEYTSDFAGADYYEENWGKPAYDEVIDDVIVHHEAEYYIEILDITNELAIKKASDEAKAYLASTDYLIIRELDAGTPCPANIKALRAEARLKVI